MLSPFMGVVVSTYSVFILKQTFAMCTNSPVPILSWEVPPLALSTRLVSVMSSRRHLRPFVLFLYYYEGIGAAVLPATADEFNLPPLLHKADPFPTYTLGLCMDLFTAFTSGCMDTAGHPACSSLSLTHASKHTHIHISIPLFVLHPSVRFASSSTGAILFRYRH
jgi:hypothetical protein